MPSFSQIYSQFNNAKANNLIGPDESLSDFARKALAFTGDPSYQSVAEGGMVGNFVRGASADLTNFVNSGPVDEWTSEAVGQVGDLFGINSESSRAMGARLPRMVVDFLPMMAAAPFTGGASLLPAVGMGVTSALSAASAYEDTGDVGSAIIGGAAPYLGTALAQRGGQAALGLAAKSPALQKLGFTGGTKYVNAALSEAERASLAASGNLSAEAIASATVNKTVVEKLADKGLGYLGGQLAANAGFFGIDTAYHGPSTTFNRDYLFNSLVGNVAFGLADIPRAFRPNVLPGSQKFNLPEASPIYLSDGERRAILAASKFADLKSPEAVREYRQKYGLDMADIAIRTEELAMALNAKESGLRTAELNFVNKWNNYIQQEPLAGQIGLSPIQRGGAFGKELIGIKEVLGKDDLPIKGQEIVDEFKEMRRSLKTQFSNVVRKLGTPVNTVESLKKGVMELGLDEFLKTPVAERDYATALKGTWLSLDGVDLIRDIHRAEAGLEPVRPELFQEFKDMFAGKPATFTPDKKMELLVAASLARGQTPKFDLAKRKAQEAVQEGQPDEVVVEEALKGMEVENGGAFRQPVIPDFTQSGLLDLGQGSTADLRRGMVMRLGGKTEVIPEDFESGLTQAGQVEEGEGLLGLVGRREIKSQLEQTAVEKLVAAIPAKWPAEVQAVVAEFYRTGDDTKLKELGTDKTSELRKKIAYRSLREADPIYDAKLKAWEKAFDEREAKKKKILNQVPVHDEELDADLMVSLQDYKVEQQLIPLDAFFAKDWSRVKDQQGQEYLVPLPEGEHQRVAEFARGLMAKIVPAEVLPEASKELVDLARLFNNPEVAYAEMGRLVNGTGDARFAQDKTVAVSALEGLTELRPDQLDRAQVERAKTKYKAEGKFEPIVFTYDPKSGLGVLTDGNHRLQAAKELGIKRIPVEIQRSYAKFSGGSAYGNYPEGFAKPIGKPGQEILSLASVLEASDVQFARVPQTPTEKQFLNKAYQGSPKSSFYNEGFRYFIVTRSAKFPGAYQLSKFIRQGKALKPEFDEQFIDLAQLQEYLEKQYTLTPVETKDFTVETTAMDKEIYEPPVYPSNYKELYAAQKPGEHIQPKLREAFLQQLKERRSVTQNAATSDAQFARASAGAFDFGMREVQNGKLIRPGKPPLGTKDGWMTELEFRVNGGELGPLQKDEVAFYKQLVPEAFANDKVHLQKLWDGLGKVGEQVKVVTYGQDGQISPEKVRLDELIHTWYDMLSDNQKFLADQFASTDRELSQQEKTLLSSIEDQAKLSEYKQLKKKVKEQGLSSGPRATSYYDQISPFDTKKFPVVRVDVVLPTPAKLSAQELARFRELNTKSRSPAEQAEYLALSQRDFESNKMPLWSQDNLHENLPNTLGWAMVQIVPDPRTGENVMFVGEAQSRWGQERNKLDKQLKTADAEERQSMERYGVTDKVANHPLLPIHQNLILKSVIKEAQKRGIRKVAISDGETAMMTEGHDTAAQMFGRGSDEQRAELNRLEEERSATIRAEGTLSRDQISAGHREVLASRRAAIDLSIAQLKEEIKVPRRPSQEGGMRLAYDTTLPSIMSKLVGEGQMEDFGPHKNQLAPSEDEVVFNDGAGEQPQASLNKGSPVFRNPDGTPKTNVTARVYDISNPSPRAGTLFAQSQGRIYGSASYNLGQILINSKAFQGQRASDRLAFVFAHEQSHISFSKALNGKYGPQAKIQAEKALAWVRSADPQAKKNVEDVLKELHLDKELAGMDGVRDVLNNPDPEEWLANVMGMYGLGLVKAKAPKKAFAMLPKPVRQFTEWMVSHLQGLVKGAKTWLKLSGGEYEGAKKVKDLLDTVRRSYREAEWDAIQAEKFLDIEPSSMLERANEFAFARGSDKMGEVGEQPFRDAPKRWIGSMWNKIVQPMHTLANTHKEFVEPVMAVMNSHSDTENNIGDVFKVVVGELGADEKVRMTNKAFKRVMGSESLKALFNAIQTRAEVVGKRMITVGPSGQGEAIDFDMLSPELRGRFQQFNPEAQRALVTMIAQAERANMLSQKKFLEADWQGSVYNFATLLASKASFQKGDFKKAVAIAEGVFGDLKGANAAVDGFEKSRWLEQAKSKLVTLDESEREVTMQQAQEMYGQFAGLEKFYKEHPTFMSFRRYGKIKQRIEKNGMEDVIDADTERELAETLKNYTAQGWKEVGPRKTVEKKLQGQYRMNEDLLRLMQAREKYFKEAIEASSLPEAEKAMLKAIPSASDAMISEINSRELYRPTKKRKLSGDLERFDWWEQFQRYTPAAIAAAQKRALGAKVNFWMQNPELVGMKLQKDQFLALFEQSKKPDPEWARKLNKLNAVWHIGWNLPGHVAEVFQPMLSGVHELVAKGESLPKALGQFYRAEKDTMKVWAYRLKDRFFQPDKLKVEADGESFEGLPAVWLKVHGTSKENVDIARMLHAKRDRIQKAPLSEIREFTGENHAKLQDAISGERERTLGEIISSSFTMYANAAMNFYSKFTQHNGIVAMVTAYRKFRKNGLDGKPMTHEQAMDAAELFDLTVNNSGGRLERPEMFGKLGGAGHLPYGLTSYVRGRFSQLATYYRHGFDEGQFKDKLTPAEMKNARKAFQTMILAQIGAAGVLGLPFVGAGIALMEELLGEDLKGKMINALDEVTNDPNLTRVFTHGMMATMAEGLGIPADLHSRFAMSSFLGTNAYDGISAKSFMGPSVAMLSSMFNLGGQIAKGESLEKALTVAGPGGVRRLTEALSEEYQRDNPEANLAMSMLGFRSSEQVKRKEWDQITRKQELETRRKLEQSAMEISKAMALGIPQGRAQLLIEAEKLLPKGLDYQATVKQRQQNIKDLVQKVSMLEADKVAPQDVRREISGRLAPLASQTAQSMGVQMSDPMELARALQQQKTRSQLGATVSQRPVRNAMLQEMQWGANPWNF